MISPMKHIAEKNVRIPKVNKTALSKEDDVAARGHRVAINLGLDVDDLNGVLLEPRHIDLNVEVANAGISVRSQPIPRYLELSSLGDNGVFWHNLKVLGSDDVPVSSSGNEDIGARSSLLHGGDLVTSHRSLESIDRVDLGDDDASTVGSERLGTLETQL